MIVVIEPDMLVANALVYGKVFMVDMVLANVTVTIVVTTLA